MSTFQTSLLVFACVFGASLSGVALQSFLPEHHLSLESKDIIKASRGVIVGLAALTLGLLIATAKTSFDTKVRELKDGAARMILLDQYLVQYGPEASKARDTLHQFASEAIHRIEQVNAQGRKADAMKRGENLLVLLRSLTSLQPANDSQVWLKTSSLALYNDIALARWKIYQGSASSISFPVLAILVFWLMAIFFSLGMISPRNASVIGSLTLAAVSMTGAILLTLELDQPYSGLIQVSTEPIEMALRQFSLNR